MRLQGFEKIHYIAYALFFLGKIMFITSVGALYSGYEDPLPFGIAYVVLVFLSFSLGMYDQWRTVGFGLSEHNFFNSAVLSPVEKHKYETTLKPVLRNGRE